MMVVKLFSTSGCHLCDEAKALLAQVRDQHSLQLQEIEIADSDELIERYGIRIPVLRDTVSGEELNWPFDLAQLKNWLHRISF